MSFVAGSWSNRSPDYTAPRSGTAFIDEYVDQGLYEGQSILVLDLDNCTRCDACTRGCVESHGTQTHGIPIPRLLHAGRRL